MSKLTENQKEVINKAYKYYLKDMKSAEQRLKYENFEKQLNVFNEKLKIWKANDDIEFIIDFAVSHEAAFFAADEHGKLLQSVFKQFMDVSAVRKNFEQMIYCKYNVEDNTKKHMDLRKCDIKEYLDTNKFDFKKASFLTGRLVLMIFTELYTTIADIDELKDVCEKLEKPFEKKDRYLAKHRQIRYLTDAYLEENNLYNKINELGRARIAWYITEV